uniref:Uncharacterized protein n=1 Tax=Rhizophora mucronata TaxID=61149 RepID=A0A2P2QJ00_RHIMU
MIFFEVLNKDLFSCLPFITCLMYEICGTLMYFWI